MPACPVFITLGSYHHEHRQIQAPACQHPGQHCHAAPPGARGVAPNATEIARLVVAMSSTIKLPPGSGRPGAVPAPARQQCRTGPHGPAVTRHGPHCPGFTRALPARWNRPGACAATSRAFATMPTRCCAWCTNACSARTTTSTRASRRCKPRPARLSGPSGPPWHGCRGELVCSPSNYLWCVQCIVNAYMAGVFVAFQRWRSPWIPRSAPCP